MHFLTEVSYHAFNLKNSIAIVNRAWLGRNNNTVPLRKWGQVWASFISLQVNCNQEKMKSLTDRYFCFIVISLEKHIFRSPKRVWHYFLFKNFEIRNAQLHSTSVKWRAISYIQYATPSDQRSTTFGRRHSLQDWNLTRSLL